MSQGWFSALVAEFAVRNAFPVRLVLVHPHAHSTPSCTVTHTSTCATLWLQWSPACSLCKVSVPDRDDRARRRANIAWGPRAHWTLKSALLTGAPTNSSTSPLSATAALVSSAAAPTSGGATATNTKLLPVPTYATASAYAPATASGLAINIPAYTYNLTSEVRLGEAGRRRGL